MKYIHNYSPATIADHTALTPGTIDRANSEIGLRGGEPIIIMLENLERYANAYRASFDSNLSEDYVLGDAWLQAATGIRALFDGNGAVAYERSSKGLRSSDSKSNGVCEALFWRAMTAAGFAEEDL